MEIWKDIENYEGVYKVSSLGRIKSLERKVKHSCGNYRMVKERILKATINPRGYLMVTLCKNGTQKKCLVHQLVAIGFLNHKPSGYDMVINHINFIKNDNRLINLEIVTARENSNRKHLKSSSKYVGVRWRKERKKWISEIRIEGVKKHLGCFDCEYEAHLAYQNALSKINK